MGVILNFGNWRKLHEAEEAVSMLSADAIVKNPANPYKAYAKANGEEVKNVLLGLKNRTQFWQLSGAVGGTLGKIGSLNLEPTQRTAILSKVQFILEPSKFSEDRKVVDMYEQWAEKSTWESFVSLFKDEPGRAEGLTDDWKNEFRMPSTGGHFNLED
jgi:hypothetical protein